MKNTASPSAKRILHDLKELYSDPLEYIAAAPYKDDLYVWHANIVGCFGTPYEGIVYHLILEFPSNYPISPPKVTLCHHIERQFVFGNKICIDILETFKTNEKSTGWSSSYSISSILLQIQSYLFDKDEKLEIDDLKEQKIQNSIHFASKFSCKCGHNMFNGNVFPKHDAFKYKKNHWFWSFLLFFFETVPLYCSENWSSAGIFISEKVENTRQFFQSTIIHMILTQLIQFMLKWIESILLYYNTGIECVFKMFINQMTSFTNACRNFMSLKWNTAIERYFDCIEYIGDGIEVMRNNHHLNMTKQWICESMDFFTIWFQKRIELITIWLCLFFEKKYFQRSVLFLHSHFTAPISEFISSILSTCYDYIFCWVEKFKEFIGNWISSVKEKCIEKFNNFMEKRYFQRMKEFISFKIQHLMDLFFNISFVQCMTLQWNEFLKTTSIQLKILKRFTFKKYRNLKHNSTHFATQHSENLKAIFQLIFKATLIILSPLWDHVYLISMIILDSLKEYYLWMIESLVPFLIRKSIKLYIKLKQRFRLLKQMAKQFKKKERLNFGILQDDAMTEVLTYLSLENLKKMESIVPSLQSLTKSAYLVERRETICYHSKESFETCILGFGVSKKGIKNIELHSPLEYLSHDSFYKSGVRLSAWRETFNHWIPLYINKTHGEEALKIAEQSIKEIMETEKFEPSMALVVLTKLMSTQVVNVMKGDVHCSIKYLEGYFHFHRLLIAFIEKYPALKKEINKKIENFLNDKRERTKVKTPNLGDFFALISVSNYKWHKIAPPLIQESFSRNILWILKAHPKLLSYSDEKMIESSLSSTVVSRRFIMFNVYFLIQYGASNQSLEEIAKRYDVRFGHPSSEEKENLQKATFHIQNINCYEDYFKWIKVDPKLDVIEILKNSFKQSKLNNYHK
jgi:ubiquitin-protein ligase